MAVLPVVLYVLVRLLPAKFYMPRHHQVFLNSFRIEGSVMGVHFRHSRFYNDYSDGFWRFLWKGPYVHMADRCFVAALQIGEDSVSPSGVAAIQEGWHALEIWPCYNGLKFAEDRYLTENGKFRWGQIEHAVVRHDMEQELNGVEIVRAGVDEKMYLLGRDGNYLVMKAGQKVSEARRSFLLSDGDPVLCLMPQTIVRRVGPTELRSREGGKSQMADTAMSLLTELEGGAVSTNSYYNCCSNIFGITTVMGSPANALFVECVDEKMKGERASLPPHRKYWVWSRTGRVSEVDVPYGEAPDPEVALHTAADGRRHIVTLWAKKARRRSVDFRVTFVDLANGERKVRDVTVPVPEDSGPARR